MNNRPPSLLPDIEPWKPLRPFGPDEESVIKRRTKNREVASTVKTAKHIGNEGTRAEIILKHENEKTEIVFVAIPTDCVVEKAEITSHVRMIAGKTVLFKFLVVTFIEIKEKKNPKDPFQPTPWTAPIAPTIH